MITSRLPVAVLLALSLALPLRTAAQALPKTLVCYDDIFEPFFMEEGDHMVGINVDLVSEAARRLGIAVVFQRMPFRRLEFELTRGADSRVDCGFAMSKTAQRAKSMLFGQVVLQPTDYTLFVRDASTGIRNLNDLRGKVIGVRSGFRVPDVIAEGARDRLWHVDDVDNDETNFKKLMLGRVDAVLTNRDAGIYTLRKLNIDRVHGIVPAIMHFDTYMVFSEKATSQLLASAFDHALADMIADGTFERLRNKYLERVK